jgi:DcuC family C4-dicarboxylate transporter
MQAVVGLVIIAVAVIAIVRRLEVRFVLILAAIALGLVAGQPSAIVRTLLETLTKEQFVVPICSAMGFAYVLRLTECDQHLVHFLTRPLERTRTLIVPGAVLVGFFVNIPVVSQTSTAVAIGSVLVPLLAAARISPVNTAAALLLGCSIGGELLNPAAPEFRTISQAVNVEPNVCVERVLPLIIPHLIVATLIFWWLTTRDERRHVKTKPTVARDKDKTFRINPVKAIVPLVPITLLLLTGAPFHVLNVRPELEKWLVTPGQTVVGQYDSRLIGAAMLVGVVAAALTAGRRALGAAAAFFEGAGHAFATIISVIVAAACFGKGVESIGLADRLGQSLRAWPPALIPTAGALPLGFAWVSGSGMASTQSLYSFFVHPAQALGLDPVHVGAVVSIGAAAGRTMSPVAAVTLMCAALTESNPFQVIRRVIWPLLAGMIVVVVLAAWRSHAG